MIFNQSLCGMFRLLRQLGTGRRRMRETEQVSSPHQSEDDYVDDDDDDDYNNDDDV